MRFLSLMFLAFFMHTTTGWEKDLEKAKQKAHEQHKYILLNFSGSDWCGPCIRMHKEIFESDPFKDFAEKNLVLVKADFPRLKKNQLSKDQQAINNHLAEQYDPQGSFPMTVLLDETGKTIQTWEGYPQSSLTQFVNQLKGLCNAR